MNDSEIFEKLNGIFSDIFFMDAIELKPTTTQADIAGWDSMKQVEIILAIEENFDIMLNNKEIDRLHCVGDMIEIISAKTKEMTRFASTSNNLCKNL